MSRDAVAEILDVKRPLESGRKEPAERSHQRRKNGHEQQVEVVGRVRERRDVSPKLHQSVTLRITESER